MKGDILMAVANLTKAESRLADIIWEREPMSSSELVHICGEKLEWKKTTAYTMLKKLENKGLFLNDSGTVRALLTKDEFAAQQSREFISQQFDGSLPRFFAAFTRGKGLSDQEVSELQKMIDQYKGE